MKKKVVPVYLFIFGVPPSRQRSEEIDKIYSKCGLMDSYPYWYFECVYKPYKYIDQCVLHLG